MKRNVMLTVVILLLASVSVGCAAKDDLDKTPAKQPDSEASSQAPVNVETDKDVEKSADEVIADAIKDFPEYDVFVEELNMVDFTLRIVEDNQDKRIIIMIDAAGVEQYKSIYLKKTEHLKIVSFSDELLVNEVIGDNEKDSASDNDQQATGEFEEMVTITSKINVEELTAEVVEDNQNNRVIIFKDDQGKTQYKSVYLKRKENLKIIDLDGGIVFHENI